MDAHIIFGVISVYDNKCAPSIDALRTTHGDNSLHASLLPEVLRCALFEHAFTKQLYSSIYIRILIIIFNVFFKIYNSQHATKLLQTKMLRFEHNFCTKKKKFL